MMMKIGFTLETLEKCQSYIPYSYQCSNQLVNTLRQHDKVNIVARTGQRRLLGGFLSGNCNTSAAPDRCYKKLVAFNCCYTSARGSQLLL